MASDVGANDDRVGAFKRLAVAAAARVAGGQPGYGVLIDDKHGREAIFAAAKHGLWIAKPIEEPGSRPLRFEFSQDAGSRLVEWPVDHVIKCLCFYHPDDDAALKREQGDKLLALYDAARKVGRELLIEIIAGKNGPLGDDTVARALAEIYALGVKPDWWKLEPQSSSAAWAAIDRTIRTNDPWCRGVVLLGLDAPRDALEEAFAAARAAPMVKGFAVGRTIFADAAKAWFALRISDEEAINEMASRFAALTKAWTKLRQQQVA
jgi:5-dehydro-2-deoxygluconokinase